MRETMTPQELEARLNAHRELIIDLLAAVIGGEKAEDVLRRLRDDASVSDYEEDPGVMPDEAFALENATASETRAILDAARARASANSDTRV
ncbi:hypothetical protein EPK99_12025 [Neorhizobium lilium]|uniref:Uncharacterized protein n=1 Tax=Neorhizobium lilium TaxID=2503024 RepID=A0A3S4URG2_9HYPH|nr:hypothetical protein [Neorhizobium lilium]RWX79275.1 hypothetical protein EPK99_12025 [Neorhizobium lilium]